MQNNYQSSYVLETTVYNSVHVDLYIIYTIIHDALVLLHMKVIRNRLANIILIFFET